MDEGPYRISNYGRVKKRGSQRFCRKIWFKDHLSPYVKLNGEKGKLYNLKKLVAKYWILGYDPNKRVIFRNKTKPWECSMYNITQVDRARSRQFSRLTPEMVEEIKQKLSENKNIPGYKAYLARQYGVSFDTIGYYD